jgi:hypothetical protein
VQRLISLTGSPSTNRSGLLTIEAVSAAVSNARFAIGGVELSRPYSRVTG